MRVNVLKKRIWGVLAALVMCFALLPGMASALSYYNHETEYEIGTFDVITKDTTELKKTETNYVEADGYSYYVVEEDVTIEGVLTFQGNIRLIICDGCTLTVKGGIASNGSDNKLEVYSQEESTGSLVAGSADSEKPTGISINGDLVFAGGKIEARGSDGLDISFGINVYGTIDFYNCEVLAIGGDTDLNGSHIADSVGISLNAKGHCLIDKAKVKAVGGAVKLNTQESRGSVQSIGMLLTGMDVEDFVINESEVECVGGNVVANAKNTAGDYPLTAESIGVKVKENQDKDIVIHIYDVTFKTTGGNVSVTSETETVGNSIGMLANTVEITGTFIADYGTVTQGAGTTGTKVSRDLEIRDRLSIARPQMALKNAFIKKIVNNGSESNNDIYSRILAQGYAYYNDNHLIFDYSDLGENIEVKAHTCNLGLNEDGKYVCANGCGRVYANLPINYIDENGNTWYTTEYTVIDEETTELQDGCYVVTESLTLDRPLEVNGEVLLILGDNTTLTVNGGFNTAGTEYESGDYDHKLTISAESKGSKMGKLVVSGGTSDTIDSGYFDRFGMYIDGDLIVNAGSIKAIGGDWDDEDWGTEGIVGESVYSYGIYVYGSLIVNGGEIEAVGGDFTGEEDEEAETNVTEYLRSYGIGVEEEMTVNGGKVSGTGGNFDLYLDGTQKQWSFRGYGIRVNNGELIVCDGTVKGVGGDLTLEVDASSSYFNGRSYGIHNYDYNFKMYGGTVEAIGGKASVEGVIEYNDGDEYDNNLRSYGILLGDENFYLYDGTVKATSGDVESDLETDGATGTNKLWSMGMRIELDEDSPYGCYIYDGKLDVCAGTVNGIFEAYGAEPWYSYIYSCGLNVSENLSVDGGEVNATAKNAYLGGRGYMESSAVAIDAGSLYLNGGEVTTNVGEAELSAGVEGNIYNYELYIDKDMTLDGGSAKFSNAYINILTAEVGSKVADILKSGYAYWHYNEEGETREGNFIDLTDDPYSLCDVYIVKCEHKYSDKTCVYCGKTKSSGGGGGGGSSKPATKPDTNKDQANKDETNKGETTTKPNEEGGTVDSTKKFTDVNDGDYFCGAVDWALNKGVMRGTTDSTFAPNELCTRAQLVTCLWRAAGQPTVNYAINFADVDPNAYYAEAVRWATSVGIVTGYENGLFGTNDMITREQMATILYRFANFMKMNTADKGDAADKFADFSRVSKYAVDAVNWTVKNSIMQGTDGQIAPQDSCTRAQSVTMLYRMMGK